jgi:hypothetical protein
MSTEMMLDAANRYGCYLCGFEDRRQRVPSSIS